MTAVGPTRTSSDVPLYRCYRLEPPGAPAGGGGPPLFRRRTSLAWGWLVSGSTQAFVIPRRSIRIWRNHGEIAIGWLGADGN